MSLPFAYDNHHVTESFDTTDWNKDQDKILIETHMKYIFESDRW